MLTPVALSIEQLTVKEFFDEYWEKKPLVLRRSGKDAAEYYAGMFDRSRAGEIVHNFKLQQFDDFVACRYTDSTRDDLAPLSASGATLPYNAVNDILNKGYTIQFFQPQRYSDFLWDLQSHLETLFGALVGSSAYLTPKNTQGLAPHHDDVEVFILQTEGSKTWRLYNPIQPLARGASHDLPREVIGEPTHEFTLNQGDLLYFPRGVVHEAVATDSFSTHVTVSTYQRYSHVDFLTESVPLWLSKYAEYEAGNNSSGSSAAAASAGGVRNNALELRRGMPFRCVYDFGARQFHAASDEDQATASTHRSSLVTTLKQLLHYVADSLVRATSCSACLPLPHLCLRYGLIGLRFVICHLQPPGGRRCTFCDGHMGS